MLPFLLCCALLLPRVAPGEPEASVAAFGWLHTNRWFFPNDTHTRMTDRVRYCKDGACTGQIGTPESVMSLLVPLVKGRMLCDIGSRTGEVLQILRPYASRLYGIELNPRYARTAKQRGLPVVVGDAFKVPFPSGCQTLYFWVKAPMMERFYQRIKSQFKDNPSVVVVLPAEYMEHRELMALLEVRQRHGGLLFKVPFHEGDGFRQFGVILFLVMSLSPDGKLPENPLNQGLTSEQFTAGERDFRRYGWLFRPEAANMPSPDCGPGISRTSLTALRELARGRHFCDLYARNGALLSRMQNYTLSVTGSVEKDTDLPAGMASGFNVTLFDDGVPPHCDFFYVSHSLPYHLKVAQKLATGPISPTFGKLVVAAPLLDRVGVFRFWAANRNRCRLLKIPSDNLGQGVGFTVFFLFTLGQGMR